MIFLNDFIFVYKIRGCFLPICVMFSLICVNRYLDFALLCTTNEDQTNMSSKYNIFSLVPWIHQYHNKISWSYKSSMKSFPLPFYNIKFNHPLLKHDFKKIIAPRNLWNHINLKENIFKESSFYSMWCDLNWI
jgi:hypothetical protein